MSKQQTCQAAVNRSAWRFNPLALSIALALGGVSAQALAAAPDAGQTIGNIATATYTDGSGVVRPATSNPVSTTVLQVASFDLTDPNTKYVTLGGQVVFPHTLTNTGNGTDTFLLTATQTPDLPNPGGDNFTLGTFAIYADADGNGIPDNAIDLNGSTVSVPRNGNFTFVVVGYAPASGLVDGNIATATVTADSQVYEGTGDDPADDSNLDTAILTADAVINVTKAANVTQGPTGTLVEYTITYTNVGNNTATLVTLTDAIPAGMTYFRDGTHVPTWNGSTQTDGADGDVFSVSGANVTAAVGSVAPNVTGQIKFWVQVDATTAPGTLINTANYTFDPDGPGVKPVTPTAPSNDVPFDVLQTRNVAANDDPAAASDGGIDDTVTVASALQGATVVFNNEIWNQGNGTDTFNITYTNVSFPAGTSIFLYKDDGLNQLIDTNGDSIPDTGPVAAGARYTVVLKAVLPASASGNNGGAGFDIVKTATSTATGVVVTAGDQDDTVTDHLDAIVGSTVDLENATLLADGTGAVDNGGLPWTTQAVNPGQSATFVLKVENTSLTADNYNFLADDDGTFGATDDVPAGWSVTYYQDGGVGDCSTLGGASSNTGTVNAGVKATYCAVVAVPANAAPVTAQSIYFQTTSPLTGAVDSKLDAVTVNTIRDIQISTNNGNTVYPGGTVDYVHIITNNGNVTEGTNAGVGTSVVVLSATNSTGAPNPWNTQLFYDANNNGSLDVSEAASPISDLSLFSTNGGVGLTPGESIRIFARVLSNVNANPGDSDVATVTVTTSGVVNVPAPAAVFNTDTTSVIGGQVRLFKYQALDANCDGTEEGSFVQTALSAKPGACIIYRIVATNQGVSAATTVVINDATPTYTTLDTAGGRPTVTGVGNTITASPGNNNAGNVQATIPSLNGGASETMEIGVQIDN